MNWLPLPSAFAADLRAAAIASAPTERLERLARLSNQRLDFLQTIQLEKAIRRERAASAAVDWPEFRPLKLALLASCTADQLVPGITVAALRRRLLLDTFVAPYGQYRQAILDIGSPLREYRPNFILLSLSAQQITPRLTPSATKPEADAAVAETVNHLRTLWTEARQRYGATVIQQTFLNVAEPLFGSFDRTAPGSPAYLIEKLNAAVTELAVRENVLILDVAADAERAGLDAWFDAARWFQGKMEISPRIAPRYGELLARVIGAERGLSKKCLVLDLDNTLWGGVVGDVGLEGIVLGEGSGTGEAFLALQRYAKRLRDRGIVLAVCSKNEASIAETAFREHPEMALTLSDIAVFVANWEDKASNLLTIANRLNLGLESLVFVDDNPAERARVRESLPMIAVPELPDDPSQYARCLADAGYFEAVAYTTEDAQRAEQYSTNAERETLRESAPNMEAFLEGLKMEVAYGAFRSVDLQRVAQLINKTNQFNPTTRRYSLQEVVNFASAPECMTLQFRLLDRFGDNGLVSVMVLRPCGDEPHALEIDTWVMSCRVFGRQLEFEAMNIAVESARSRGIKALRASYVPTAKNAVVKDLYATLGFAPSDQRDNTGWRLDLDDYAFRPTFISRQPHGVAESDPP